MFPHHSKDKKSGFHIPAPGFIEKPIAGLVGTIGNVINSIDGHNTPVPSKNGTSSETSSGTEATASWDDGKQAKVKKVQLTFDEVIYSIQVSYDGTLQSQRRGSVGPKSAEFTLGSDEYITALSAYSKTLNSQDVITSLTFSTNKKTYGPYGKKSGFQISAPEATGQQIAGFLGTSGNVLNSIDVHYAPVPTTTPPVLPKKLKALGGDTGAVWDDGHHDNVKKVYVGQNQDGVGSVKFEYVNGSQVVFGDEHGKPTLLGYEEFELESDEYITSVEGTYDQIFGSDGAIVTMLLFKTSKNKTYGPYGLEGSSKLTLKEEGYKVVGFHGLAGESINAIGVYVAPLGIIPLTPATRIKKLEGYGGVGGTPWDDGAFDGIRKVYVGKSQDAIAYVKFEYVNGSEVVVGDEHGTETSFGVEEFEVDEDDSIVYVEGYRAHVGNDQIIAALIFKTYKGKSSKQFGTIVPGNKFVLQGGRIIGFHGRSTDVLVSLGAYILTSSTPNIVGKWIKVDQAGEAPGLRCSHAVAQIGNKIYSFGGELIPNQPIDKDLYVFDLENGTWSISPATGDVPHLACLGVCMVSVGSTLYVFGGRDTSRQYNGFYSFDTTKNEWKLLTPVEEGPTPRSFHSMAADDNHVYVFGGVSATTRVKNLDAYNIAEQKWVQCSSPGDSFNIRGGAGLQVVEGKVWVIYGFTGYELDDVHYYDPVQDEWTHVETFGEKPAGRSVFSSAVVGRHILIFGGELDMDPQAHVGPGQLTGGTFALDTETLVWERVDKLGEEEETPEIRGWAASTTGIFDGKKGLVMHGGKAQTNDRFKDLYFYKVGNA